MARIRRRYAAERRADDKRNTRRVWLMVLLAPFVFIAGAVISWFAVALVIGLATASSTAAPRGSICAHPAGAPSTTAVSR